MPKRLISLPQTQPARTIVAIAGWITFLAGLWALTPWYEYISEGSVFSNSFSWPTLIGVAVNCLMAVPAMWGTSKDTPNTVARGAHFLFMWYLFVTFSRIATHGIENTYWIPTFVIALIMAVVKIEQTFVWGESGELAEEVVKE